MAGRTVADAGGTMVLDAGALIQLSRHDQRTVAYLESAHRRGARVVVAVTTLPEVLRGRGNIDATMNRILKKVQTVDIDERLARLAATRLGETGMDGHSAALDALVAAVALSSPPPVLVLTSDPDDLGPLVETDDRPKNQRVAVVRM